MSAPAKAWSRRDGAILIVTIDRPEARNAIDTETTQLIAAAMDDLDGDAALRVGVITGAGGTFSAGMDLKAFLRGERPSLPARGFAGITRRPPGKPLIAAVEGPAMGGGFEIALACDLIVASESARFALPEVRRGLMAAGGGLLRLPQRVPRSIASEWVLTGAPVPAEEAYRVGLVNRLTPVGGALDAAVELARVIAANGPLAVAGSKEVLLAAADWPTAEAFDRQQPITERVRSSVDAREGATAFVERREPRWQGR